MKFFENFFSKEKDIEIQSLTYGLNLFIPTFILILSSLFENYELTAELGILIGVNVIFTQIFSSNARSLIISKKSQTQVINIKNQQDLEKYLKKNLIDDELIICMGAGSISNWIREIGDKIK